MRWSKKMPVYCVYQGGTLITVPYWRNFVNRVAGGSVKRAVKMCKGGFVRVFYLTEYQDVTAKGDYLVVQERVSLPRDLREFNDNEN